MRGFERKLRLGEKIVHRERLKLEMANRLDLLDAVGDRALGYFHGMADSEMTGEELT